MKPNSLPDYILWDFNGTILDDVETGIRSVNQLLRDRGLPEIPDADHYRQVFGFPIRDYYSRLGFDFTKEPYEAVAVKWVELYLQHAVTAPLCPGILETLDFFKQRRVPQIILSATQLTMLEQQLTDLGIRDYFTEVMGLDNIYATSKTQLATAWRERHPDSNVLMLGDTTHDYEVACAMDAACILIEGGHQPRSVLASCGCPVIHNLFEISPLFS